MHEVPLLPVRARVHAVVVSVVGAVSRVGGGARTIARLGTLDNFGYFLKD